MAATRVNHMDIGIIRAAKHRKILRLQAVRNTSPAQFLVNVDRLKRSLQAKLRSFDGDKLVAELEVRTRKTAKQLDCLIRRAFGIHESPNRASRKSGKAGRQHRAALRQPVLVGYR